MRNFKKTRNNLKLLDLFCGAGGSAVGYHRAGFEVVGVDINPQPRFPFEFHQANALEYPLNGFDVIHASPPCQAYSKCTGLNYRDKHPRLISIIRDRLKMSGVTFVIENVEGARKFLEQPIMLCGSMFGLPIRRHRYFEIKPNFILFRPPCNHKPNPVYITGTPRPKHGPRKDPLASVRRAAMETPWMTIKDMDEAIPPAYTHYIGKLLIKYLDKY